MKDADGQGGETGEPAIGALVRDARIARGLTQAELAAPAGLSRKHVVAIERGGSRPSLRAIVAIADALDADDALRLRLVERAGYTLETDAPPLEARDEAVTEWLAAHRAQPVLVFSPAGALLEANERGNALLYAVFHPAMPVPGTKFLDPSWWSTIRSRVVDFETFARALVMRMVREAALRRRDGVPQALLDAFGVTTAEEPRDEPFLRLTARLDHATIRVMVVFTTAGEPPRTPSDGRTVVLVVPTDEATRAVLAALPSALSSPA